MKPLGRPLRAGSRAHRVGKCTYLCWSALMERHGGDTVGAKAEYEACVEQGLWEEHAGVVFVLMDVEWIQEALKVEF